MARSHAYQNGSCAEAHSLEELVYNLREYLGSSGGIDSAHIEVEKLRSLLASYRSKPTEWLKYGTPDPSRNYTRLLIDNINGKCNLLFLVWNPLRHSPIHDHADAHCVMKILQGSLNETVYEFPTSSETSESPLEIKKKTLYKENEVAYICDNIGVHRISNPDTENLAVSLHLYTPPNAADFGFNIFDEKTGRSSHVQMT